ncbi:hypothetical protein [Legionella tunisiensis]|uniref:hypothetical protein n=1 Tax=Legionella tunisiensis TaxID=1034944 RepID=UPI0002ECFB50|nr:hypothetical protein [Legionella tunisiensis]
MPEINQVKAEQFAEGLLSTINHAVLALMISIGHRSKLFDTMSEMNFATSEEIAQKSGLNERYVREWLNALATGQIIEYNASQRTYHLPPEHAAFLTRTAAQPDKVLRAVYRALKPKGTFLMQDIKTSTHVENNMNHPIAPLIYTISCMHCMTVSLSQNGAGLGAAWGEELAEYMLRAAGFTQIRKHYLEHDIMNIYYVVRK